MAWIIGFPSAAVGLWIVDVSSYQELRLKRGHNGPKLAIDCDVFLGFSRRRPGHQLRAIATIERQCSDVVLKLAFERGR
jgi:hypothetical protein